MSPPYRIVRYEPAHKPQVANLERSLWCQDLATSLRYFEWKYEENPYAKDPALYLAFAGSELVGIRGFYGSRWEAGLGASRAVTPLLVADDFIVAPAHRNRGLVSLIMRTALEDLARRGHRYVLNLSGSQVTHIASLAMGWKSAGFLEPIGLRQSSLAKKTRARLSRTRFFWRYAEHPWLFSPDERAPFRHLDTQLGGGPISIEREPRPDAMCELIDRLGHDGRIRHVRDREYHAWRFKSPLAHYRFVYHGSERLEGFLVLQVPNAAPGHLARVRMVDLEGTSPAVRAALIDRALEAGRFSEPFAWAATLPEDVRERLAAHGWRSTGYGARDRGWPSILVKSLAGGSAEPWVFGGRSLTKLADWDLRMLDTMAG
jgi:GNAT superfamily N-acetyltransferase